MSKFRAIAVSLFEIGLCLVLKLKSTSLYLTLINAVHVARLTNATKFGRIIFSCRLHCSDGRFKSKFISTCYLVQLEISCKRERYNTYTIIKRKVFDKMPSTRWHFVENIRFCDNFAFLASHIYYFNFLANILYICQGKTCLLTMNTIRKMCYLTTKKVRTSS